MRKISRRNLLRIAFCSVPVACIGDGFLWEPRWLAVRRLRLARKPLCRLVHFSDLHYKGDRAYTEKVVDRINEIPADLVCFTGDIIEDSSYLAEALGFVSRIKHPVYGVPGNHDYWSGASFDEIAKCFEATGGAWLVDEETKLERFALTISGSTGGTTGFINRGGGGRRLLLVHYPKFVEKLGRIRFDLALAGHSHGGQVRIPLLGAPLLPYGVGRYDRGLFRTPAGPLYVSTGIGTWYIPVRFFCRPEITIIEI